MKNLCIDFYCSVVEKQIHVFAKIDSSNILMNYTLNFH